MGMIIYGCLKDIINKVYLINVKSLLNRKDKFYIVLLALMSARLVQETICNNNSHSQGKGYPMNEKYKYQKCEKSCQNR